MAAFADIEEQKDGDPVPKAKKLECDKVKFNIDSCVPDPQALPVLRAVYELCHTNPDLALLVTSHTDAQNKEDPNQKLSDARSKSIVLLLTEDVEHWATHVENHRKTQSKSALQKDVDDVLSYFADLYHWPEVKPPARTPANEKTPCPDQVLLFKKLCDARYEDIDFTKKDSGLEPAPDGDADHDLWFCAAVCYQQAIRDQLSLESMDAMNENYVKKVQWLDPKHPSIGCGERLLKKTDPNDPKNEDIRENRRTEFLFFSKPWPTKDPKEPAPPAGQPPVWLEKLAHPSLTAKFNAIACPTISLAPKGDVLFVLDCSGSMKEPIPHEGRSRMQLAKAQLVSCLKDLDPDDRFGIMGFASEPPYGTKKWKEQRFLSSYSLPVVDKDGKPVLGPDKKQKVRPAPQLEVASKANRDAAIKWIHTHPDAMPDGATMTANALEIAFKAKGMRGFEEDGKTPIPMTVVLITDGQPTITEEREAKAKKEHKEKDLGLYERNYIKKMIPQWNAQGWNLYVIGILNPAKDNDFNTFLEDLTKVSPVKGTIKNKYTTWRTAPKLEIKETPKK